jgi:hypothetical protein
VILLGNPYLFDGFPSAPLFLRGFRLRPLLPLVRPFHEFVLFLAISLPDQADTVTTVPFLKHADNLVVAPFALLQVIIDKLAPLLFQVALKLHPFPFELIRMHGFRFLCEMAISHCSYRSGRIIHNSTALASMARRPAAMWSELLSLGELMRESPGASGVVSTSFISSVPKDAY